MSIVKEAVRVISEHEDRQKLEAFLALCNKVINEVVEMKIQAVKEFEELQKRKGSNG